MLRAFQIALPSANARRYGLLLCFLPSMLFWPSSIGKEAWMMLAIGLFVYGAARLFAHQRGALLPMALGLAAGLVVRPHIAVLLLVAASVGFVVRPRHEGRLLGGPLGKFAGVIVLVFIGAFAAQQMQESLHLESASSVNDALNFAEERTNEGGSSFRAARIRSPADVPWATVTVLFRPFPYEANNAQMAVSAAEGFVLLLVFLGSARHVARALRSTRRQPYCALVVIYAAIFVYAFSTFGNFGIITRQRVQLLPFVLVLLCAGPAFARSTPQRRVAAFDDRHGR
jgi:hypothetical protein